VKLLGVEGVYFPRVAPQLGHPGARLSLLVYSLGGTLAQCDRFGIPSTSHWMGAAIIV
jgi:hypothetical protein